jgi:hypothetical protein
MSVRGATGLAVYQSLCESEFVSLAAAQNDGLLQSVNAPFLWHQSGLHITSTGSGGCTSRCGDTRYVAHIAMELRPYTQFLACSRGEGHDGEGLRRDAHIGQPSAHGLELVGREGLG